jgi:hypothetical protein
MNANGESNPHAAPRPTTPADFDMGGPEAESREANEPFVQSPSPSPAGEEQPLASEPPFSGDTSPFR